jgi:hypothetical protein
MALSLPYILITRSLTLFQSNILLTVKVDSEAFTATCLLLIVIDDTLSFSILPDISRLDLLVLISSLSELKLKKSQLSQFHVSVSVSSSGSSFCKISNHLLSINQSLPLK